MLRYGRSHLRLASDSLTLNSIRHHILRNKHFSERDRNHGRIITIAFQIYALKKFAYLQLAHKKENDWEKSAAHIKQYQLEQF